MVNAKLSVEYMNRLKVVYQLKRLDRQCSVISQRNIALRHDDRMTKYSIKEFSLEFLPHPIYSLDLAPSDYHIFLSFSNNLRSLLFNKDLWLKTWLNEFSRQNLLLKSVCKQNPDKIGYFYTFFQTVCKLNKKSYE